MPMGSWFRRPAPALLGVDISTSSIKLVELGQERNRAWMLERCAIEPLEKGCVADGNIEKFDEVAEALRRAVKKLGTKARQMALALPPTAVITQYMVLPAHLGEQELERHVESEASQYIPFSLDGVSLDFCVVGPHSQSLEDVDVLLAASRTEKVQDRQGLAEAVGMTATVVDIETHAARRAAARLIAQLPHGGADALVGLLRIGSTTTDLQVLRNDELLFERGQGFGGAQLTQMLAQHYGFSIEEAEVKKRSGALPGDHARAVLQPFIQALCAEVMRALQFFFSSTSYPGVDQLLVFGGSASLDGIAQALQAQVGVPVSVANPFHGMRLGSEVRKSRLDREAPSYLTACGLAMRRFVQ